MGRSLYKLFPHLSIKENYRPEWFNLNGIRLEFDFYIESLKCGIEVQGSQHYEFVEFFHRTYEEFLKQIERDNAKKILCNKFGIKLYEVSNLFEIREVISELSGINVYIITKQTRDTYFENKLKFIDLTYRKKLNDLKKKIERYEKTIVKLKNYNYSFENIQNEIDNLNYLISCKRGMVEHAEYKKYLRCQRGLAKRKRGILFNIQLLEKLVYKKMLRYQKIERKIDKEILSIPCKWANFWRKYQLSI